MSMVGVVHTDRAQSHHTHAHQQAGVIGYNCYSDSIVSGIGHAVMG